MARGCRIRLIRSMGARLRARGFSDDARVLVGYVWMLMGMPCGKYLVVMLESWLPLLAQAGDLDKPFATDEAMVQLKAMSAATVDRYLKPARDRMGVSDGLCKSWKRKDLRTWRAWM